MDYDALAADLAGIHSENETSIMIRRGATTLTAQIVRIARLAARGQRRQTGSAEEVQADVLVSGAAALDIRVDDRFTAGGLLYQVLFVRPNRRAGTQAEAKAVG